MRPADLPRGEIEALVRGVAPEGDLTRDRVAQVFASAAWSVIAEPGDGVAGVLVAVLGAERALATLTERCSPSAVLARLAHAVASPGAQVRAGEGADEGADMADEAQSGVEAAGLSVREVAAALERWMPRVAAHAVIGSLRAAAVCGARLITPADTEVWPTGFADLGPFAPLGLWVRGDPARLAQAAGSFALVGSRDATHYGEHVAMSLASGLCDAGVTVVSGAAYGIDGMAHRAALAAEGTTVAYLAGGVDRLYPAAHHELLRRVMQHGAVVAEVPCGTPPTRWRFLQRNRLIAAGSDATVVVEAGHRSGSLNTAGHAAALGRPLGAVPGPVTSSASAGCHRLMREYDARCVTSAADALELIDGFALRGSASTISERPDTPGRRPAASSGSARAHGDDADWGSARHDVGSGRARRDDADSGRAVGESGSARAGRAGDRDGPDVRRVCDALSAYSARGVQQLARATGLAPRAVAAALGTLALDGRATETEAGWRSC